VNKNDDYRRTLLGLAESIRLDLMQMLCSHSQPLTPVFIAAMLGEKPSTVSHHLNKLEEAGLVISLRSGRNTLYSPVRTALTDLGTHITQLGVIPNGKAE
jgi:DNA-binding transcriptional ArsR family regulator